MQRYAGPERVEGFRITIQRMAKWFNWLYANPIFTGIIGSLMAAMIVGLLAKRSRWMARLRTPPLRKTNAYPTEQTDPGVVYPLKYYVEAINDSRKCVAVRVSEFKPTAVTLQKFVPDTLQVMLNGWCPRPNTTDSVALLPNQRCRAWIGVDAGKFTKADLERLEGKIGTLTLTADGKKIPFAL
jgi:hypothetical protein